MQNELTKKIAVVTGANRGLGLAAVAALALRGYRVFLTTRDLDNARPAHRKLTEMGLNVELHPLDVADPLSRSEFCRLLHETVGRLDVLINNAAVMLDTVKRGGSEEIGSAQEIPVETVALCMETNVYGPYDLIQKLAPLMRKGRYGRIVNVSSGLGQLQEMGGNWPGYRISKTALSAVTKIFAAELKNDNILVNSVSPGWARTRMGGASAPLSAEQGADSIVWAATLPDHGPNGCFIENRTVVPW